MSEVTDPGAFALGVLVGVLVSSLLVSLLREWLSRSEYPNKETP